MGMKLSNKGKKTEKSFERSLERYSETKGIAKDKLRQIAEKIYEENDDVESKVEALSKALEQMSRTNLFYIPVTEPIVFSRDDQDVDTGRFYAWVLHMDSTGEEVVDEMYRQVKIYGDRQEDVDNIVNSLELGKMYESDTVWGMTRTNDTGNTVPIRDSITENQIYGIKGELEEVDMDEHEVNLEKMQKKYAISFDLSESANDRVQSVDDVEDLAELINDFESFEIYVLGTPFAKEPTSEQGKPYASLDVVLLSHRGEYKLHNMSWYFDAIREVVDVVESADIPFKAMPKSYWKMTSIDENGEVIEGDYIRGRIGTIKYGIKNLEVLKKGEELFKELRDDFDIYNNVYEYHDPSHKNYEEPQPDSDTQADLYSAIHIPYMEVDGENSFVRQNDTATLELVFYDEDGNILSGRAYGNTALKLVGAESSDDFVEKAEELDGIMVKDVYAMASRSSYRNNENNVVSVWSVYGVHSFSEIEDDEEIDKVFSE